MLKSEILGGIKINISSTLNLFNDGKSDEKNAQTELINSFKTNLSTRLTDKVNELAKLKSEMRSFVDNRCYCYNEEDFNMMESIYNRKEIIIYDRLEKLRFDRSTVGDDLFDRQDMFQLAEKYKKHTELTEEIYHDYIQRIQIFDHNIKIIYKV